MGSFVDCLNSAVAELQAAGIHATLDPRDLQLPGVWVKLVELRGPTLAQPAGSTCVATFYAAVATMDLVDTLSNLAQLLDQVVAVVPPMTGPRHVALALPGGGTPASALAYDHQLVIT